MNKVQMSETVELGAILAVAGGFMDAYSYICRGNVFANAQTGNLLLLGISLAEGEWLTSVRYFTPVIAFCLGIVLAELIRHRENKPGSQRHSILHWRQIALLLEMVFLSSVAFFPQTMNLAANSITSLACGIQVQSFRKICGHGVATTMCIGNLRSGTESLCRYFQLRNTFFLHRAMLYFGIIAFFIVGAVAGNYVVGILAEKSILVCMLFLAPAFFMMFRRERSAKVLT